MWFIIGFLKNPGYVLHVNTISCCHKPYLFVLFLPKKKKSNAVDLSATENGLSLKQEKEKKTSSMEPKKVVNQCILSDDAI